MLSETSRLAFVAYLDQNAVINQSQELETTYSLSTFYNILAKNMAMRPEALPKHIIRAGTHGSQVSSPTHVTKSQHGGKVPTFELQEIIRIWLTIIKIGS
jgi:hypothetical protein